MKKYIKLMAVITIGIALTIANVQAGEHEKEHENENKYCDPIPVVPVVPEPSTYAAGAFLAVVGIGTWYKYKKNSR